MEQIWIKQALIEALKVLKLRFLQNRNRVYDSHKYRALDTALESGDRLVEAELLRLQGEFKLLEGELSSAQRSFVEALEVASSQNALAFELRAAMSMHRLGLEKGDQRKTRQSLEKVFKKFGEGFDTPDLKQASDFLVAK